MQRAPQRLSLAIPAVAATVRQEVSPAESVSEPGSSHFIYPTAAASAAHATTPTQLHPSQRTYSRMSISALVDDCPDLATDSLSSCQTPITPHPITPSSATSTQSFFPVNDALPVSANDLVYSSKRNYVRPQSVKESWQRTKTKRMQTAVQPLTVDFKFVCETCGKGSKRRQHHESHLITHSSEYAFPCSVIACGWRGRRQQDLVRHARVEHPQLPAQQLPSFQPPSF